MLVVTFSSPIVLVPAQTGSAGGSVGAKEAGVFYVSAIQVLIASTVTATKAIAPYTTDVAGLSGVYEFAYDPTSQTLEAALSAALTAAGYSFTFSLA